MDHNMKDTKSMTPNDHTSKQLMDKLHADLQSKKLQTVNK